MPCDGGIGECLGCDEVACLNESGYCSDYCENPGGPQGLGLWVREDGTFTLTRAEEGGS